MLTPLVIEVTRAKKINPVPYLIALAGSANVGSAATMIGNPQNVLIGAVSGIGFFHFVGRLIVPVVLGLVLIWVVILAVYRKEFSGAEFPQITTGRPRVYRPLLIKSLIGIGLMLGGIVFGLSTTLAALVAASFLLITRRIKPDRVLRDVDWTLLVFFAALFVLTDSVRSLPSYHGFVTHISRLMAGNYFVFSAISAIVSNLISNVPAVMLLKNIIEGFQDPRPWWLLLSMATTFAGNLTLLGSVANLIVAEGARKRGVELGFGVYLRIGVPVTLATIALGTTWLLLTR
jgi:Na+/H+ antiporter NhaD/arsenite permease-like protein